MTSLSRQFHLSPVKGLVACVVGIVLGVCASFSYLSEWPELRLLFADILVPVLGTITAFLLLFAAMRVRKHSTRIAQVWFLFGLAQISAAAGDWLWTIYELVLHIDVSPSLADALYLIMYPLFLVGIFRLPVNRKSVFDWSKLGVDLLLVMVASLVGYWSFLMGPMVIQGAGTPLELAIILAYPTGDLMLVWGVMLILYRLSSNKTSAPLWFVGGGLFVFVITDSVYSYKMLLESYQSGDWLDIGYVLGYALLAAGGLLQGWQAEKHSWVSPETQPREGKYVVLLTYLPYTWVIGAFVILAFSKEWHLPVTVEGMTAFLGGITALVVTRQVLTIKENNRLSGDLYEALEQVKQQALTLERTNREMQAEIRERVRVEEQLTYDALHDSLTGLPNRTLFLDRLEQATRKKRWQKEGNFAVLFLDLDSFKVINDSLGHQAGDYLLVKMALTLKTCIRPNDTVARLGGDEFVILLEDINNEAEVVEVAECLQGALSKPVELGGLRFYVSVSIGIVSQVDGYERPEDILRDADLAMYQAKSQGKACYVIFDSVMRSNAISRMTMESELRRALECHELMLYYQPVLSLPEGHLSGFEALVRWQHPQRGLLSSGEFIPIAEETGLILPMGTWVLFEACRQARDWQARYPEFSNLRVSVNISGKQLKQENFVKVVMTALESSNLPSQSLVLEVTESVCLDDLASTADTLKRLQELGVEIQIDDFGTGYSSLSYLQSLPVRSIKIDKCFIQSITSTENQGPEMVRGILALVNDLGIKAVAEGIETETQLDALNRLRCAYGQGFYLARPMDIRNIDEWINRHRKVCKPLTSE